jgi:hypothetical protein
MISPSAEAEPRSGRRVLAAPRAAFVAALVVGWLAMLVVDLPGHLTLDSLVELYEGRFRVRQSWAPSFYAWVLGRFDAIWAGTGLYVAASGLLLVIAWASLAWLAPRTSRWGAPVALAISASPLLLIYQGVVWKDVLFANCAVAGMIAVAWAVRPGATRRALVTSLLLALLLLSAAALLRQNGVVVGIAAAAVLGFAASRRRIGRGLAAGVGALAAVVAASHGLDLATQPGGPGTGGGMSEGVRILQGYDLLGAVALDPKVRLPAIEAARPQAAAAMRALAPGTYSAERTDVTDGQPQLRAALAAIPDAALGRDWRNLVLRRPGLYLRARSAVFAWVFLTPRPERCLPVALGVQGPAEVIAALGLRARWSDGDSRLLAYDSLFLRSPIHAHLAYAAAAVAVMGLLARRRRPQDLAMIGLMAAGLGFAASFFVISIACDYRYLYFLDLAAMSGLIYLAVDPPWRPAAGRQATEQA